MKAAVVVGAIAIAALVTGAQAEVRAAAQCGTGAGRAGGEAPSNLRRRAAAAVQDLGAPFAAIMKRLHKIDSQQRAISDNMESVRANRAKGMVHSTVSSMLDKEDAQDRQAMTSAAVGRIKSELAGEPDSAAARRGLRFASRAGASLHDKKKDKALEPEDESSCGEEIGSGSGSGSGSLEDQVQEAVDDAVGSTDEDLAEGTSQDMQATTEEANAVKKEEEEAEQELQEAEESASAWRVGVLLPSAALVVPSLPFRRPAHGPAPASAPPRRRREQRGQAGGGRGGQDRGGEQEEEGRDCLPHEEHQLGDFGALSEPEPPAAGVRIGLQVGVDSLQHIACPVRLACGGGASGR